MTASRGGVEAREEMMRPSGSGLGRRLGWAESSGPPEGSLHLDRGVKAAETAIFGCDNGLARDAPEASKVWTLRQ